MTEPRLIPLDAWVLKIIIDASARGGYQQAMAKVREAIESEKAISSQTSYGKGRLCALNAVLKRIQP